MNHSGLYHDMVRIRLFEETILANFSSGVFHGTTHTSIGQEANAVGVLSNLENEDIVFSNHRCHGHFLVYGGDMRQLFAELLGKSTGVCAGRGGSQHIQWKNFYSNGIQGGIVPVAVGMALAEKYKKSGAIVVAFLGDGTLGEGAVYEAFNLASLWQTPILFVVENNHIAQTTPVDLALSGSIAGRFKAFNIPALEIDSSDVIEIQAFAARAVQSVRQTGKPQALILHTQRLGPHSKGDDTRSAQDLARLRQERDPLRIQAERLDPAERERIEAEARAEVADALERARKDPEPSFHLPIGPEAKA